jgi:hypothetical protein
VAEFAKQALRGKALDVCLEESKNRLRMPKPSQKPDAKFPTLEAGRLTREEQRKRILQDEGD